MELTGVGIWSSQLRYGDASESAEAAAELEELGFTALWIPDVGGPVLDAVGRLLAATKRTVIATGILNLWMHSPGDVADSYAALTDEHGNRFLLGIGVSHAALIDAGQPGRYRKPLAATASFLDGLDAAPRPVPTDGGCSPPSARRCWPCPRTAPAVPTRTLSPLSTPLMPVRFWAKDRCCCRSRASSCATPSTRREASEPIRLRAYLSMPNYANNLLRSGFSEDDLAQVSDRLFDALIAWGDEETIMRRVAEHHAAGADHVCVQVLTDDPRAFPREEWRRIASACSHNRPQ